MKIIVSGGGTGGHIYPAITIINAIKEQRPDAEFLYVGTTRGLEADIVPKEGLPFIGLDLEGFERHLTPKNLLRAVKASLGVAKAAGIVHRFQPDLVIGTGGYVAGPILLAASLMHVPTLVQEHNVVAGITNKILSHFVTKIAVGTKAALKNFPPDKTVFTGNPIRREVMSAKRDDALKEFHFTPDKKIVLISGGSRGARSINRAMINVLTAVKDNKEIQWLLVTGKNEFAVTENELKKNGITADDSDTIKVMPYLYNMPQAMAMADLAVFRAGATGLAELTARGVPAVLIPYPYAAENHQEFNARELEEAGAAKVILNKDLTGEKLLGVINNLLQNDAELTAMSEKSRAIGRPNAAETIASLALGLV